MVMPALQGYVWNFDLIIIVEDNLVFPTRIVCISDFPNIFLSKKSRDDFKDVWGLEVLRYKISDEIQRWSIFRKVFFYT